MIKLIIELPEAISLKDKRSIVVSLKKKLQNRFKVSAAEIDLHGSLGYTQIGAAIVSNSKQFGESVMNKVLDFVEDTVSGRVRDVEIYSETF